jgi:hypothetical protein
MRTLTRLACLYMLFSSIPYPLGDRDSDSIKLKCAAAP